MRVLIITNTDHGGGRFNGIELADQLRSVGHEVDVFLWEKINNNGRCHRIAPFRWRELAKQVCSKVEYLLGIQSLLHLYWGEILFRRAFWRADVIHLHLVHASPFSVLLLPLLTLFKPTVWTLHDPWALTGHCLYPFQCARWKRGCGSCPDLKIPFAVRVDRTHLMWSIKRICYRLSHCSFIVASPWMERMFGESRMNRHARHYLVPFGLDLSRFEVVDKRAAKRSIGLRTDLTAIGFRNVHGPFKGFVDAKRVIASLVDGGYPISVVAVGGERGNLSELGERVPVADLGWLSDEDAIVRAFAAMDLFLMPSTAEAFGLMAVEAMACGTPVVCYDGTALPDVVQTPVGGIAVPYGDVKSLCKTTADLVLDSEKRERIAGEARRLCEREYSDSLYIRRIEDAYRSEVSHRQSWWRR